MHMDSDIQTLSLMLSKVLDNIGVNSRIVSMRRRTALMAETVKNLNHELHGIKLTAHIFGSSSEGTTTPELKPDLDVLSYDRLYNVITSMDEWEPNVHNLLMIQGNDVAPGYCMLQVLREDAPLPVTGVLDEHEVKDSHGRVMLKKSFIHSMVPEHFELHGPSFRSKSCGTADLIYAFPGLQNVGFEIKVKRLKEYIEYLKQLKSKGNNLKRSACAYLLPVYFTLLGSVQASHSMQISQSVSPSAIVHLSLSLNSDVASGRLKLASVYYCTDNIESCEVLLKDIERRYDFNVCFPACVCYAFERKNVPIGITQTYIECRDEQDIESTACFCVIYMPNELIPKELYFELFRSTRNELRIELPLTRRMNWGVVDSITYLYFLQYKVNSRLQRPQDQKRALNNLALYIDKEHHLGHRETALNLLGQCMEQENRHKTAFKCYWLSLKVRSANNAARVHICRLLNNILNTLSTSK